MKELDALAVIAGPDWSIDATIRLMAARSKQVTHAGLAVVVDADRRVLGVLTDGDIRRAYSANLDLFVPVTRAMVASPITVPASLGEDEAVAAVYRRVRESKHLTSKAVRHVLVVDDQGRLVNIYDFLELLAASDYRNSSVAVFGMGYVGLTLAASLANRGHDVTGIDISDSIVATLMSGRSHVHEPGIEDMLKVNLRRGALRFQPDLDGPSHGVYIVAVGTPLDAAGVPDMTALNAVAERIATVLRHGDLVMLRSTVPVGTTRDAFIPLLESRTSLKAGTDFHVAFAPERTVEGDALHELRTLPQIVGGFTQKCTRRAADFWSTLTPSVVRVSSLEAAEMVKLANNCFRDLSFAFANEIALAADRANIDAFELIQAANEGYPRNRIPLPSPGVGGYCLTKDPVILRHSFDAEGYIPRLGVLGRDVNRMATLYPVEIVRRYAARIGKSPRDLTVLLVGVAFKGEPETSDLRGSVSLDIARALEAEGIAFRTWDALVSEGVQRAVGLTPVGDLLAAVAAADCVLLLNNHRKNTSSGFISAAAGTAKLIFDGWSQLDRREVERTPGLVYASMGYMTPEDLAD
jgi:UDP-N-acetyl-D-mannosaminuronic acid dehydrogenase